MHVYVYTHVHTCAHAWTQILIHIFSVPCHCFGSGRRRVPRGQLQWPRSACASSIAEGGSPFRRAPWTARGSVSFCGATEAFGHRHSQWQKPERVVTLHLPFSRHPSTPPTPRLEAAANLSVSVDAPVSATATNGVVHPVLCPLLPVACSPGAVVTVLLTLSVPVLPCCLQSSLLIAATYPVAAFCRQGSR